MAAIDNLTTASTLLPFLLNSHPQLMLLAAVCQFDPLGPTCEENGESNDTLEYALIVSRIHFPDVYVQVSSLLRNNASIKTIENTLVSGFNQHLIVPINYIEDIQGGPPIEFYGIDLPDSCNVYASYNEDRNEQLDWLYTWFGLIVHEDNNEKEQSTDHTKTAVAAARMLITSLLKKEQEWTTDLAYLLMWAFGLSGNTAFDCTQLAWYEGDFEPLGWTQDDVDFINALHLEGRQFQHAAERGQQAVHTNLTLTRQLKRNINIALTFIKHNGDIDDQPAPRFRWTAKP